MTRAVAILTMFVSGFVPTRAGDLPLPTFEDVTEKAGIHFKHSYGDHHLSNIVEGTGPGCAFFDYDGDGYLDIYFLNGCWLRDVNDNLGRDLRGKLSNALYRSNGDGTFTDVSSSSGLADPGWSLSAPWLYYDGDGDLDVYVANYLEYDQGKFRDFYPAAGYPGPLGYQAQADRLYRNDGDGTFADVTRVAGLYFPDGRAMSAVVTDLNNDGHPDLYVTNDATPRRTATSSGTARAGSTTRPCCGVWPSGKEGRVLPRWARWSGMWTATGCWTYTSRTWPTAACW